MLDPVTVSTKELVLALVAMIIQLFEELIATLFKASFFASSSFNMIYLPHSGVCVTTYSTLAPK
jgi:hypothetical protein